MNKNTDTGFFFSFGSGGEEKERGKELKNKVFASFS